MLGETIAAESNYYPVCPYCELEIEETENPSYETEDMFVYMYRHGKCFQCGRRYAWQEIYKWDETFYDIQEE